MATIVVLGGCGGMAKYAVRFLLLEKYRPLISKLIIADLNIEGAQAFARSLQDGRVEAIRMDVGDSKALVSLLKGCDIVANFVGPFFKFASLVMSAAIEAKCHYLDIMDDTQPTLDTLEFDAKMKEINKVGIVGIGASPGLTNILVRYAVGQLDRDSATDVVISWGDCFNAERDGKLPPKPPKSWASWLTEGVFVTYALVKTYFQRLTGRVPMAVTSHFVEMVRSDVQTWLNGNLSKVPALTPVKGLFFPNLSHTWNAYYVNHPENVTLGHAYPELRSACNLLNLNSSDIEDLKTNIIKPLDEGNITVDTAALLLENVENAKRSLDHAEGGFHHDGLLPVEGKLLALVKGKKNGKDAVAAAGLRHTAHHLRVTIGEVDQLVIPRTLDMGDPYSQDYLDMGTITGCPLAIAAIMLLRKEIKSTGVVFPEMVIDSEIFFNEFGGLYSPELRTDEVVASGVEIDTERVRCFPFDLKYDN